jgi:hypothetical protein
VLSHQMLPVLHVSQNTTRGPTFHCGKQHAGVRTMSYRLNHPPSFTNVDHIHEKVQLSMLSGKRLNVLGSSRILK